MDGEQQDRRGSFRMRLQCCDVAVLRLKKGERAVQVVEKSAGGFGLLVESGTAVKEGDIAVLTTSSGRFQVEVRHVTDNEDGSDLRVGLKILGEDGEVRPTSNGWSVRYQSKQHADHGQGRWSLPILCAVLLISALTSIMYLRDRGPDWGFLEDRDIPRPARQLGKLIGSKEFTAALNLTPQQEVKVNSIVRNAVEQLNLATQATGDRSTEVRAAMALQVLLGSWEEVLAILDEDQVARWNDLLRSADANRSA